MYTSAHVQTQMTTYNTHTHTHTHTHKLHRLCKRGETAELLFFKLVFKPL